MTETIWDTLYRISHELGPDEGVARKFRKFKQADWEWVADAICRPEGSPRHVEYYEAYLSRLQKIAASEGHLEQPD